MIKKSRKRLSNDLKKKAKYLFESGLDMSDISFKLNINLQTLYNTSSKEKWEKGKNKELISMLETENKIKDLVEIREDAIKEYIEIEVENRKILKELQKEKKKDGIERTLIKHKSEAVLNYMRATETGLRIAKELYNITTPTEEIELKKKKIEYERLKRKLEQESVYDDIEY